MHPLLPLLLDAADGRFPADDGAAVVLPPLARGLQAVVSFTARAYVCTSRTDLPPLDGYGAALQPAVLQQLAGDGEVGVLDVLLVGRGTGGGRLPPRADAEDHPRVRLARALREDVRVHGDARGLVTLALGAAGRTELSVEAARPGVGHGRDLVREGLALAPPGEPVFAAVSPGNARSLRLFLALGFAVLGSEVLLPPA